MARKRKNYLVVHEIIYTYKFITMMTTENMMNLDLVSIPPSEALDEL